jgi:hypothetical protein
LVNFSIEKHGKILKAILSILGSLSFGEGWGEDNNN